VTEDQTCHAENAYGSSWLIGSNSLTDGKSIGRREFLRVGAGATLGFTTGQLLFNRASWATSPRTSRVVVVTDEQSVEGSIIQPDVVRIMLDEGLVALTDAPSPQAAWQSLLPGLTADTTVGIKVNCASAALPSHPQISYAIAHSLAGIELPFGSYDLNQILIWERTDWELTAAGYSINTSPSGLRCFGTTHQGVGFDSTSIDVDGTTQFVSRCYSDHSEYLINLSCLKNHGVAGVTLSLKNHFGTVHNAYALHSGNCDPGIPALNAALKSTYGERERLSICDALFGIRVGGPTGPPQFTYGGLVLSTDPVAIDAVCRQILEENGCNTIGLSSHIDTASQAPYNLGVSDLDEIELIEIINPSASAGAEGEPIRQEDIVLRNPHPEPFSSETTIPFTLRQDAPVRLTVHDFGGRRIATLFNGYCSAGEYQFSWAGRDDSGRVVPNGCYMIRLSTNGKAQSRRVTLLR
jgi:hypothetical protein